MLCTITRRDVILNQNDPLSNIVVYQWRAVCLAQLSQGFKRKEVSVRGVSHYLFALHKGTK
jgi:hypothetical protein